MSIVAPSIFPKSVIAGYSTTEAGDFSKDASNRTPHGMNAFFKTFSISPKEIMVAKQAHTNQIHVVGTDGPNEYDAIICNQPNVAIAIVVADCGAVVLHDPVNRAIGVVHSGWRGSAQNILGSTVSALNEHFGSDATDVQAWIGPLAQKQSYPVRLDVAELFEEKYSEQIAEGQWLFDNRAVLVDQLKQAGLRFENIETSELDTVADSSLFSFRRDGQVAGRSLVFAINSEE